MRERSSVSEIVYRDEIQVEYFLLFCGTQHLSSDAPETIDADTNGHSVFRFYGGSRSPAAAARPNVT
jgi:hypothetical protein